MMVRTGIDIIETSRIQEGIEKYGDKFLNRIFTNDEIIYCESKKIQKYQSYAGRFAAKEAVFKALSDRLKNKFEIEWKDIEIINTSSGKPNVLLHGELSKILNTSIPYMIDVSISHIEKIATASCVVMFFEGQ